MRKNSLRFKIITCVAAALAFTLAATEGHAVQELDRKYSLETIGVLRSWDNADGLFSDYVATAYKQYFSQQSRFLQVDLSKADILLGKSALPYNQLIDDKNILSQISKSMRSQTILRTKIYKEGPTYRFVLDWMHAPHMEVLAAETFVLEEPQDTRLFNFEDAKVALMQGLDRLIKKIPFHAQVSGRDDDKVTVLLGDKKAVRAGDTLIVATTEDVKLHPILKSVMDWRFTQTGRLEVESVDDGIAFCKIAEEEPGRKIGRYQKVVQVVPASRIRSSSGDRPNYGQSGNGSGDISGNYTDSRENYQGTMGPLTDDYDSSKSVATFENPNGMRRPTLGYGTAGFWMGTLARDFSNATTARTGSGFLMGVKVDGRVWLTPEWFADAGLGFGTTGYQQKNSTTGTETLVSSQSASAMMMRLAGGYQTYLDGTFFGPKAWVVGGYHRNSYKFPYLAAEALGSTAFGSLFIGLGGDLPITQGFGALFNFDIGLIKSASETDLVNNGSNQGITDVGFFVGGYYRFADRLSAKLGLDYIVNSTSFEDTTAYTNKIISFGPSVSYYF